MVSVNDNLRAGNLAREAVELVDAGHKEVCYTEELLAPWLLYGF